MDEDYKFEVWENGVPVIIRSSDFEFEVWENGVPLEDQYSPEEQDRRRSGMY